MIKNGISASEDKIVGKRFESFYWISIYNIYALLFNYSLFTLESNTLTHLWICCDIWGWITGNCLICLWKISFPLFEQTPLLTAIEIRTKWRIDKFMVFLIPLTSSSVFTTIVSIVRTLCLFSVPSMMRVRTWMWTVDTLVGYRQKVQNIAGTLEAVEMKLISPFYLSNYFWTAV